MRGRKKARAHCLEKGGAIGFLGDKYGTEGLITLGEGRG